MQNRKRQGLLPHVVVSGGRTPTEVKKRLYPEYSPILYHVSPMENAKSIEEKGIIVPNGHSIVSLSMNKDSWFRDGMCLFEVNVDGLGLEMRTFLPELDEIIVFGSIPKERVKRLI